MRMSRSVRAVGLALLAYVAVAAAYTWPLAIRLNGVPHDLGDPLLTTWFLWWSGTQAVPLTAHWWSPPTFYPAAGVLGFSEHLLGLVPIALPFILLTGRPLVGHNVAFIATFVLSALGAHFLAYTLTGRHDVSAVAAIAFAFAPYRLPQTPHIQVLASYWTPVCLAALHRYDRTARPRWAVAAAAAWALQALSCGYYLFFLAVLVALWFLWFTVGRWPVRQVGVAAAAFAGGALLLAPFLRGTRPSSATRTVFSARSARSGSTARTWPHCCRRATSCSRGGGYGSSGGRNRACSLVSPSCSRRPSRCIGHTRSGAALPTLVRCSACAAH